jgi:hypothetical protein
MSNGSVMSDKRRHDSTVCSESRSTTNGPSVKPDRSAVPPRQKPSRLWLWFIAAFILQGAAWTTWFVIASHHTVAEVPLATKPVR